MDILTLNNVQHYCRTCLAYLEPDEKIGLVKMRYHLKTTENLADWIENSTSLSVLQTSGDYPQFVCDGCFTVLKDFNKFRELVWRSAHKLNALFRANPTKDNLETEIKLEEFESLKNATNKEPLNKDPTLPEIIDEIEIKMNFVSFLKDDKRIHKDKQNKDNTPLLNPVLEQSTNVSNKNDHDIQDGNELEKDTQHVNEDSSTSGAQKHVDRVHKTLRPFPCQYCHRPFGTERRLKIHERIHTGEKPYACDVCGHRFIRLGVMKAHRRKHNLQVNYPNNTIKKTTRKKKECHICKNLFDRKYVYTHILIAHKGIQRHHHKKYACKYCSLRLGSPCALRNHERIHTGEKPFPCDICDRRFINLYDQNKHRKAHFNPKSRIVQSKSIKDMNMQESNLHENSSSEIELKNEFEPESLVTEETLKESSKEQNKSKKNKNIKEYKCVQCGCSLFDISTLSKHMADVHDQAICSTDNVNLNQFPCCICQKTFKARTFLTNHISNVHKEANSFPCRFCHLYFGNKIELRSHERIHTSLRPFKCDNCDFRFTRLGDKTKHQRLHEIVDSNTASLEDVSTTTAQTRIEPTNQGDKTKHQRVHELDANEIVDSNTASLEDVSTTTAQTRIEPTHEEIYALEENQSVENTTLLKSTLEAPIRIVKREPTHALKEERFEVNATSLDSMQNVSEIEKEELQNETNDATKMKLNETLEHSDFEITQNIASRSKNNTADNPTTDNLEMEIKVEEFESLKNSISNEPLNEDPTPSGTNDGMEIKMEFEATDTMLVNINSNKIQEQVDTTENLDEDTSNLCKKMKKSSITNMSEDYYKCLKCDYSCAHVSTYKAHLRQIHNQELSLKLEKRNILYEEHIDKIKINFLKKQFECTPCQITFSKRHRLTNHIRIVHKKLRPFPCQYCNLSFATNFNRNIHERVHTGEKPFSCDICERQFAHASSLKGHKKTHKNKQNKDKTPLLNPVLKQSTNVSNKNDHDIQDELEKDAQHANEDSSTSGAQKHVDRVHKILRPFPCQYCPSSFTTESRLKIHQRIHSEKKPYACNVCGLLFIELDEMKVHRRNHNVPVKYPSKKNTHTKKQCHMCNKLFNRRHLNAHILSVHKGIQRHQHKEFACQYCSLKLSSPYALRQHERVHTLDVNMQESDLNKKSSLDIEMKNEFEPESLIIEETLKESSKKQNKSKKNKKIKEYKCVQCGCSLFDISTLSKHMADMHDQAICCTGNVNQNQFPCCICKKTFKERKFLARHLSKVHKDANPFPCCFCHLHFRNNIELRSHERLHTSLRPFKCDNCDYRFTRLGDKTRHQKVHELEANEIVYYNTAALDDQSMQTRIEPTLVEIHALEENQFVENTILLDSTLEVPIRIVMHKPTHVMEEERFEDKATSLDSTQNASMVKEEIQNETNDAIKIELNETFEHSDFEKCTEQSIVISDSSQDAIFVAHDESIIDQISLSSDDDETGTNEIPNFQQILETNDFNDTNNPKLLMQSCETLATNKEYKCTICCHSFPRDSVLNEHMQQAHTKVIPLARGFKCQHCNKNFIIFSNLNNHMRIAHKDLLNKE